MSVDLIIAAWLSALVINHRHQFPSILLKRSENAFIIEWINKHTPLLQDRPRKIAEKIWWILNGVNSWDDQRVCCHNPNCRKHLSGEKMFRSISIGYNQYCGSACSNGDSDKQITCKKTRFDKNNGKYFSDESIAKAKRTFIQHYGVDNNMKSDIGRREYVAGVQQKYGEDIVNPFQADRVKAKICESKIINHGDAKYNNSEKAQETVSSLQQQDPEYWNRRIIKTRNTWLKNYGVDHPMKNAEIKIRSCSNKCGERKYAFLGFRFRSRPELAFAIYCYDHNVRFIYEDPLVVKTYFDNEHNEHKYFPDFHIVSFQNRRCDFIVEIKSDYNFKNRDPDTGVMISLKGHDCDHIEQAKYKCIIENKIILVTTKRYKKYIDYAKKKYGYKYYDKFIVRKSK